MTPQQIALVQHGWAQVAPLRHVAAPMFYERLFELDPRLRPRFPADLAAQADKLFDTLEAVVAQLDDPGRLLQDAAVLGRSHARHGATAADYDTVCQALLWTLQGSLGSRFTAPMQAAWRVAYGQLAAAMQAWATEPAAPPPGAAPP